MRKSFRLLAAICVLTWQMSAFAADEQFDIVRFQVEGNTILPANEVDRLIAPFVGSKRVYAYIQRALEALEEAYRVKGYGTVQVYVPEQELTAGVVKLQVTEATIGKISIIGNKNFSTENIRKTLPLLKEGISPNLRQISENVQLANENPAKQVEVTLGVSEEEGKVDAKVQVEDDVPRKVILTLDNTGDKDKTGQYRTGISYRDSNLLGDDEVLTLGYITAPDIPGGVSMDVVSIGFRKPFYELGDSLDVIWGWSSVNMTSNVIAPGGTLAMNGKGDVLALRWNHLFARQGEFTSKVVFGFDQKTTLNPCTSNGAILVSAGCVSTLERVVSTTYAGQLQRPKFSADFSMGVFYNLSSGEWQDQWRYVYAAGNRAAKKDFLYFQGGGSVSYAFDWGGIFRVAVNAQYSEDPLPASDQISLAGYSAVRGFNERVVTADSGFVGNFEVYSSDLAPKIEILPGSLRALAFYDIANGFNTLTPSATYFNETGGQVLANGTPNQRVSLSSVGVGLRYSLGKSTTARFDWARILQAPPSISGASDRIDSDWRAHFGLSHSF
ncbi:MAG TPA: ShlB/FhaC/HecB family hemolysin secretion/activation protein [Rhodocyclaceae bacterium]|jgi:hemolysin activation/secretion protein